MRFWVPLAALLLAFSCEQRCNDDDNVGGGSAGVEVVVHARVVSPAALLGGDAHRDLVSMLGVDEAIVEQADTARAIDVLVGTGKDGVEAHAAILPLPGAQAELAKRYDLEPLMLRQVRIKPPRERARCLFVSDHVACALGGARLGRGTFDAEEWARVAQVGSDEGMVFSLRVVHSAGFLQQVWPLMRALLDHAFTQAKTSPKWRDLVLGANWEELGKQLAKVHVVGSVKGDTVGLRFHVPWSLPAGWGPAGGAPSLTPTDGFVALAWCDDNVEAAPELRDGLGCRARALRVRDGAEVALQTFNASVVEQSVVDRLLAANTRLSIHEGLLTSSDDVDAAREAAKLGLGVSFNTVIATAFVDLALVGVKGAIEAKLSRGGSTAVQLTLPRASFVALWQLLARGA